MRVEPPGDSTLAVHPIGSHRCLDSLQRQRAYGLELERTADQASHRLVDDGVRRCRLLEPGGHVRRAAHHRPHRCFGPADQVTYDDEACGDADPACERMAARHAYGSHCRGDRETSPDRALGLILMRLRPAEIGKNAVADELGGLPLEPGHLATDDVLVVPDHLADLFGVEAFRERGGAHEVHEHHGQLAPFGLDPRSRPLRCGAPQLCERFQDPLTVSEKHAQLLEIGLAELRQDLSIDRVLAEGPLVLRQPQRLQPSPDVQGGPISRGGLHHGLQSFEQGRAHVALGEGGNDDDDQLPVRLRPPRYFEGRGNRST
jgi:hypothetical protein